MALGLWRFSPVFLGLALLSALGPSQGLLAQEHPPSEIEYLLLAANKTSTMQKEMQEAAEAGYAFAGLMGGSTAFGGSEVVVVMQRLPNSTPKIRLQTPGYQQDLNHAEGVAGGR